VITTYPGMTIHSPDPKRFAAVDGVETWALDLSAFINDLRSLAQEAGAELRFGEQVTGTLGENNRIVGVRSKYGEEIKETRAPVVVDATGLARVLRRKNPIMRFPGDDDAFSVYMEYWKDPETPFQEGIHSYMGPNAWTAWYDQYWIVGIGQPLPLEKTKQMHAEWVRNHLPGKKKVQQAVTGAIPYAYPPPTLVDDGLLVIGDAAATNKPFNGEGIASGMILAKIAAEVLPDAVRAGGSRSSLWEINRRYFTGQGSKFAFFHAMGSRLITLNERELAAAFEIGLVTAEDLRRTFYSYEVKKPFSELAMPLLRLARRPSMAKKYGAAFLKSSEAARLFEQYPSEDGFSSWLGRFQRLISSSH